MENKEIKTKFKLYTDGLLENNVLLSHVFLDADYETVLKPIADGNKGKTEKEADETEIEIKLTINGHLYDVEKFLKYMWSHVESEAAKKATKMVEAQTSDKLMELSDKIDSINEVVESWVSEINWEVDNPLIKK